MDTINKRKKLETGQITKTEGNSDITSRYLKQQMHSKVGTISRSQETFYFFISLNLLSCIITYKNV